MLPKFLKLIIMGAPGSGKGTISKRIVNDFKLNFISSGDVLRREMAARTDTGIACAGFIQKGELVPDDILDNVLFTALTVHAEDGWLMDGYPRKISQAITLYEKSFVPDLVIDLQVPFSEIINRLKDRWLHPESGRIYNLQYKKPIIEGVDDITGEPLIQREDDHPDTIIARLNEYKKITMPVSDFFRNKDKLVTFRGTESDVIWPEVRKYLMEFSSKRIGREA